MIYDELIFLNSSKF